jgi:hypothetical protein
MKSAKDRNGSEPLLPAPRIKPKRRLSASAGADVPAVAIFLLDPGGELVGAGSADAQQALVQQALMQAQV